MRITVPSYLIRSEWLLLSGHRLIMMPLSSQVRFLTPELPELPEQDASVRNRKLCSAFTLVGSFDVARGDVFGDGDGIAAGHSPTRGNTNTRPRNV